MYMCIRVRVCTHTYARTHPSNFKKLASSVNSCYQKVLSNCPFSFSYPLKGKLVVKLEFLRPPRAELDTQPFPGRRP